MSPLIQLQNIDIFYGKRQILHDICLDLSENNRLLLIGPNGAGKSTLLKTIIGLVRPRCGAVIYRGSSITGTPVQKRVAQGIGFLMQTNNIVPGLTVEENLALAGYSLKKILLAERISAVIENIAILKSKLKSRAGLLSGGERQALAIGMVLIQRPAVMLLDEPSAGLSPKSAMKIISVLKDVQATFSIQAVCMVEHNLKTALEWATQTAVLVQGRMVFVSENPQEFISRPELLEKYFFG